MTKMINPENFRDKMTKMQNRKYSIDNNKWTGQ